MSNITSVIQPEILLKEYLQTNKNISRKDNMLVFSETLELKLDTPTPFIQKTSNKYYTIGMIWLFLKNRNQNLNTYMGICRKEKIETVSSFDKPHLIKFFIDGIDEVNIYDKAKVEECKIQLLKNDNEDLNSNNNDLELNENPSKTIIEYLAIKEKGTLGRNSNFRVPSLRFDYLLGLVKNTFCKDPVVEQLKEKDNKSKSTFLDELTSFEGKILI